MKFKDVVISEASTEAKVAALALLLDKELIKLADTVLNVKKLEGPKGEQGIQGPKGEQGDRGFDGTNGKDGADGKDGKDGEDGKQGVGVADAKIDFDGSLVITLTDGTEINAGDVVPLDTAEKIRVIGNGGGTSQSVLDAIAAIQATIATYGTMALQNDTTVDINGGAIDGTAIGAASASTGVFTTLSTGALTATGQASLGGAAGSESFRAIPFSGNTAWWTATGNGVGNAILRSAGASTSSLIDNGSANAINFRTNASTAGVVQLSVSHTASAVNYVQVTGAATGGTGVTAPAVSSQGSDANIDLNLYSKGTGTISFRSSNGRQFAVLNGSSAANILTVTGTAAGLSPILGILGSDTNISQVFQSKGTGAIDLAAGSSGVNISNGGTVTAITQTVAGSGYTSIPSVVVSAPTTAGGVQATATVNMQIGGVSIVGGGTGYSVNDVITISGGTFVAAATLTVTTVSAGVITGVTATTLGNYSVLPTNPVSVTGGTGTGATFNITSWTVRGPFTITNAGSGYVEQPTVSFSGGGGSGAAAYATVGSGTTVKSLGSIIQFATPSGIALSLYDASATVANYVQMQGRAAGAPPLMSVAGSDTNINYLQSSKGTGQVSFYTNGFSQEQLRVAHTASAVNYVQVTGAATGGTPVISMQGSDANIGAVYRSKGTGVHIFQNSSGNWLLRVGNPTGTLVNYPLTFASVSGSPSGLQVEGTDTNIDLALTPKGTGNVRFGTLTASADAPITGYITIKDSSGTVRKLAVIA